MLVRSTGLGGVASSCLSQPGDYFTVRIEEMERGATGFAVGIVAASAAHGLRSIFRVRDIVANHGIVLRSLRGKVFIQSGNDQFEGPGVGMLGCGDTITVAIRMGQHSDSDSSSSLLPHSRVEFAVNGAYVTTVNIPRRLQYTFAQHTFAPICVLPSKCVLDCVGARGEELPELS